MASAHRSSWLAGRASIRDRGSNNGKRGEDFLEVRTWQEHFATRGRIVARRITARVRRTANTVADVFSQPSGDAATFSVVSPKTNLELDADENEMKRAQYRVLLEMIKMQSLWTLCVG